MAFSASKAELVSLLIEGVLYGLYVFLFTCTIYVLIHRRSTPGLNYPMFTATVLMFALATGHLIVSLLRLLDGMTLAETQAGAADIVLTNIPSVKTLLRISMLLSEILIADIVLIYRLYVAWSGNLFAVFFPSLLVTGAGVTSVGMLYTIATAPQGTTIFGDLQLQRFLISTQALILANNIICTALLSWRLWRMSRAMVFPIQRQNLHSVNVIIVQSTALIAVTWILWICLNATHQPAHIIVVNSLAPITGGAFCLIVSRVALGVTNPIHRNDTSRGRRKSNSNSNVVINRFRESPTRPVETLVSSRESVRVETTNDMYEEDKIALTGLTGL